MRSFLARKDGKKGNFSKLANDAVRHEVLCQAVIDIREQSTDLGEKEAANLADEAVAWARADRS